MHVAKSGIFEMPKSGIFEKKTPKGTWLCGRISLVR